MNDDLRNQIYNSMSLKETDELIDTWQKHNSNQWSALAFEVIKDILRDRLGELPPHKPKKYEEFEKDYLPIWCEDCDCQGYIFVDNFELPYFVVCKTCGYETSQVWCPKCQSSGEFVENISKRPFSWQCSICKTKYNLPNGFYKNPITLFTEKVLPHPVQNRIREDFQSANNPSNTFQSLFAGLLAVVVLIAVGLLPMLLIFTPLPWSIPGFVVTLLIFAFWWWLISRMLKRWRESSVKRAPL
jgi:hypothetical protein